MTDLIADAGAGATTAAPAAAPTTPAFIEQLPEEYRGAKWAENFSRSENPLHTLAKTYHNAEQEIGKLKSRPVVPGEGATPEEIQTYRRAVGVPDSADAYEFALPDLTKEPEAVQKLFGDNIDENFGKTMKAAAHELGLTPKQFAGLADKLHEYNIGSVKSLVDQATAHQTARAEAELAAYKQVFGDQADIVKERAKETLGKIGMPKEFNDSPDAALIFAMNYIHKNMFTNSGIATNGMNTSTRTKSEIRAEIETVRAEIDKIGKAHPDYRAKQQRWVELYKEESEAQ